MAHTDAGLGFCLSQHRKFLAIRNIDKMGVKGLSKGCVPTVPACVHCL